MTRAEVLTEWVGDGASIETAFRPRIDDDYPLVSRTDTTAQDAQSLPPTPNVVMIEIVVDDTTFAQIEGDSRYIIWSSEPV